MYEILQIQQEVQPLLSQQKVFATALARFIGKLSAAILAIYPAPLHYHSLQQLKHKALKSSGFDNVITISPSAQEDLEWYHPAVKPRDGDRDRCLKQGVGEHIAVENSWEVTGLKKKEVFTSMHRN